MHDVTYERVSDGDLFKIFQTITEDWRLPLRDRFELLKVNERTYGRWRHGTMPRLSYDQRLRISYVLNIYLDLQDIYGSDDAANTWILEPNKDFSNQPPIRILKGSTIDLYRVYSYVHSVAP
jgi:putative toxin-antitoxin system antitoxin component (TIGR02293 family)